MAFLLTVSAVVVSSLYALRLYFTRGGYRCSASLKGKVFVITGANSGIGKATARRLAQREAKVIMACRDESTGIAAMKDIQQSLGQSQADVSVMPLDLSRLSSVRAFAESLRRRESRVDCLILNAGIFGVPQQTSEDGVELHFQVNHLSHFLLTQLLVDVLAKTPRSRVVVVSSSLHKKGIVDLENLSFERSAYTPFAAYCNSKLALCLFGRELSRRLADRSVDVFTLHPGIVWTNLKRHEKLPWWKKLLIMPLIFLFVRTPAQGASTVVFCATEPSLTATTGKYYGRCKEEPWNDECSDTNLAARLWDKSELMVRPKQP